MKIKFKVTNKKCDGDKLFLIETKGEEAFTHIRLMILLNQLAKNEYKIYKEGKWDEKGKDYLFPLAVEDAIEKGRDGIDFLDDKYEDEIRKYCKDHYLTYYDFEQTKIKDFENEGS